MQFCTGKIYKSRKIPISCPNKPSWCYSWLHPSRHSPPKTVGAKRAVACRKNLSLVGKKRRWWRPVLLTTEGTRCKVNATNQNDPICQCRTRYWEVRLQYFRDAIKVYRHRQPGDRYLIALLDVVEETFQFEVMVLTNPDVVESITF